MVRLSVSVAAIGLMIGAAAAETPSPAPSLSPSRVSEVQAPGTPVPGANSFTEAQARARIAERGYADVGPLRKGRDGIWRGQAEKDGKPVEVALDYQGNVVAR